MSPSARSPSARVVPFPARLPPHDGGQAQHRGALVGCGSQSAAALLLWHGHTLPGQGSFPERERLRALTLALLPHQGGVRVGRQRATAPWRWLLGTNRYLCEEGSPLQARGLWGPGALVRAGVRRRLRWAWAEGVPLVGFEFSVRAQHFGVMSGADFRALHGQLLAPLPQTAALHLAPAFGLGGVFWLETRPASRR